MVNKKFIVIAYDVSGNKARNNVAKILERYGYRVNLSVFECMLTAAQLQRLKLTLLRKIDSMTDTIVYYEICLNCYTKITVQPQRIIKSRLVEVI